jgi:hypothetical protein
LSRHRAAGRAAFAVALGLACVAAGCSSDDDASNSATTSAPSSTVSTGEPGAGPTAAQLTAILPVAADLGEEWAVAPEVEADPPGDRPAADLALEEQCPDLADLVGADAEAAGDGETVVRSFVDLDGRELEIEIDPDARARTDAELQEAVDAINACDEVVLPDRGGVATTLRFQATVDPDHGEQAVKLQADVRLTLESQEEPISLTLYGLVFRTGPVGVQLTATDGLDPDDLEVNRTDMDQLTGLSERLEASVDDLVG